MGDTGTDRATAAAGPSGMGGSADSIRATGAVGQSGPARAAGPVEATGMAAAVGSDAATGMAGAPGADSARIPGGRLLVIGCGALARELAALTASLPGVDVTCLPPLLHNRPERIPDAVRVKVRDARATGYDHVFVAYADCGTGGLLDRVLAEEGVERLPGAHCYEVYAGSAAFARLADEQPGTFYLTDFLVRAFDRLVVRGLGIDRHPELGPLYFGNYRRVVYLSQSDDADLVAAARRAADRLGLAFEHHHTGLGDLAPAVLAATA